jgi:hypothetical protein
MSIVPIGYQEPERIITTHSSDNVAIKNQQNHLLLEQELNITNSLESRFGNSKYQGSPSACYNCHGLTFASKRTGIYEDQEIWKIIQAEYVEVKSENNVIIGDVILYFYGNDNNLISHSGIVVEANTISGIRVYSKVAKGKEIVHHPRNCPYNLGSYRYYRIHHANRIKLTT